MFDGDFSNIKGNPLNILAAGVDWVTQSLTEMVSTPKRIFKENYCTSYKG